MAEIKQTERAVNVLSDTMKCCKEYRHEFVMPEHLLYVLLDDNNFDSALSLYCSTDRMADRLAEKLDDIEIVPDGQTYEPEASAQMQQLLELACQQVVNSSAKALDLPHLVMGMLMQIVSDRIFETEEERSFARETVFGKRPSSSRRTAG